MRKLATALSLSLLVLVFAASAALAQQYPPRPGPAVEVNVTVVTPNKVIKIDGSNWGPGTTVEITDREGAEAQSLGFTTVDEDGSFEADVTVPAGSTGDLQVAGVDESGTSQVRPLQLAVVADSGSAASAAPAAASQVDAAPAVSMLTPGNGAIALLVLFGALALFFGPIRRRSHSS